MGVHKIIARVPEHTTPYSCGKRLMACIVNGYRIEDGTVNITNFIEAVEFFKTVDEAKRFTEENPEYEYKRKIDLKETIRMDCLLWEKVHNKDRAIHSYMHLHECCNSAKTGLYQLILNGGELWYGTLEEINAIVKAMITRIEKGDFLE